jgi:hypothetical protein
MTLRGMILGANALKPTGRLWVLVRRQNEHETTTLPDRTPWRWVRPSSFAMKWAVTRRGTVPFSLTNPTAHLKASDAMKEPL